jgi:hypothetical protein
MSHYDDLDAPDLEPVASELRAGRPRLTALELDATRRLIRARAAAPARRRTTKGTFMKSRLGILTMLVAGMLLSTTGAGLAVSGLSNDSAAKSQYGNVNNEDDDKQGGRGNVLGEEESGGGSGGPSGGSAPASDENDLQPARQVEAGADEGGGELPFTGFAAIPVLLGGIALLTTGLVLRRRSAEE